MEGNKYIGKLYSFSAGFLFAAIIFVVFLVGFNFVLAAWTEPTEAPPAGNVAPPLNTGIDDQVKLGGLTVSIVTTTKLCFGLVGDDCQTSWNDVLGAWSKDTNGIFYDAGNVGVGPALVGLGWPLPRAKLAINSEGNEGLYISRDTSYPYSYLNIRNELDNPVFKVHESGGVGIGTDVPNKDLHIYNTTINAEIDIQSTEGENEHWGIYHDGSSDDLRFWKDDSDRVVFSDTGVVTASDFCIDGGECLISGGLVGVTYIGTTAGIYDGNRGGYEAANTLCQTDVPFALQNTQNHICTANEILTIINSDGALPSTTDYGWISNGPPGYTANANDCSGWTSANGLGPIWEFDDQGGKGHLTTCNIADYYPFLCCQ